MIAFLDVDYRDSGAIAAGVLAHDWADPTPAAEVVALIPEVADYVPGEFYRRELPCLLTVLDRSITGNAGRTKGKAGKTRLKQTLAGALVSLADGRIRIEPAPVRRRKQA